MNILQKRLSNSSHVLLRQRGGVQVNPNSYGLGERLWVREDVDLSVDDGVVSVPRGTEAVVRDNDSQQLLLDLGEGIGKFILDTQNVSKYFERVTSVPQRSVGESIQESNPLAVAPGAYVQVTGFDPKVGTNRGPNSPGHGGYQTLVGQKGQLITVFGSINGVKTYKVQLAHGGEFVLGETEFQVVGNTGSQAESKVDLQALRGLGFAL